jgi:trigger factor
MQVSIETTSGLERRMTVGIPAAQIDSEVQKRLQQASKTVNINGFRKGKVPLKVVKQRYGAGVRQEVIGEVFSRSFYEAAKEQGVVPAGQPAIEPKEMSEGKDLEYIATFDVYPEITLADTSGFEIDKLNAEVTDIDVDSMLEVLQKQHSDWKPSKRKAQKGDRVNIDYTGTKDGEAFEGGSAEGQALELGSNSMIPGFEDGLIGLKPGEEVELDLTFPEDYHSEDLKGAAVKFSVKVNSNEITQLPALDKEFFGKFGVETEDEAEFRADVRKNMERELKNAASQKLKSSVMDKLVDAHDVELPSALVASEIEGLRNQMMQQFGGAQPNMDMKALLPDDMFTEQANRRVSLGLIVGEVVKSADIKVDADKVRSKVEEVASTYQDSEEVINYYYGNQQLLNGVESVVLEDQVVEHILANAKVTEVQSSYDEVIKPAEQAG